MVTVEGPQSVSAAEEPKKNASRRRPAAASCEEDIKERENETEKRRSKQRPPNLHTGLGRAPLSINHAPRLEREIR